jgi:hypothetical protein
MGAYSGDRVDLVSYSDDFTKFMIRVFGPRMDHWLSHGAMREQMLQEVVSFLEQYDPAG